MPNLTKLRNWFSLHARPFPWRTDRTPYRVWVSEVMLQQTRAEVVISYFERWMERFPTIEALAEASFEEVIKYWEGLGYYARVRFLHKGARTIVDRYKGEFPFAEEELGQIEGLGPYTIGAIRSFAFAQKAPAIDGNVRRVLSRLLLIEEDIDQPKLQKPLQKKLLELLPDSEPWVIMESLIELGALICGKVPKCLSCPLNRECLAYQAGKEQTLPLRKKRVGVTVIQRVVAVIVCQRHVLLAQETEKRVMRDLYQFPYWEGEKVQVEEKIPLSLEFVRTLPSVTHTFTRFKASLLPSLWQAKERESITGFEWVSYSSLERLAFSAGHRRILQELRNEDFTY
jgi:A/G-specific adenine glycosylase